MNTASTRPTAPAIGSRIRITENWPQGTRVIHEGIYTGWCEPDWELDGHHRVPFSAAGHMAGFDVPAPDVTVEILSAPEPADGTWVTTPNRHPGRQPYVFHRDDTAARGFDDRSTFAEYRWYFHEDGDWVTWAEIQKYGEVTVIKDGAVAR